MDARTGLRKFAGVLVVAGCRSVSGEGSLPPELDNLVGQWQWIRSCCGFGGDAITPDPTRPPISVHFDDDGGVLVLAGSDTVSTGVVTVQQGWSSDPASDITVLRYDPPLRLVPGLLQAHEQTVWFRGADSLDLVSNCFDCHPVWSFSRMYD